MAAVELDLSSVDAHAKTAEWIRNNVVLKRPDENAVLELRVKLPQDSVTLYMDTRNGYILGFRGSGNRLFVLKDEHSADFVDRLRKAGLLEKDEQWHDAKLGADHPSLKTLASIANPFTADELRRAGQINQFGSGEKMRTAEDLQRPLSLLVCLIAESARLNVMEVEFRKLYYAGHARADKAIQCWDKAVRITEMANEHVHHLERWYRVEILAKRAVEMDDLIERIVDAAGEGPNRQKWIQEVIDGKFETKDKLVAENVKRLAQMARQLNVTTSNRLTEIVSACRDADAVWAAKCGVAMGRAARAAAGGR